MDSPKSKPGRLTPIKKKGATSRAAVQRTQGERDPPGSDVRSGYQSTSRPKEVREGEMMMMMMIKGQHLKMLRYLYHKLANFFGFEPNNQDDEDLRSERTCYLRMHVECVGRSQTGRVHFIRRATMKDADNILFSAWEKVNFMLYCYVGN
eukprot:759619-Hanusia_phi.AAC.1